jgi:DnaJ like chaperone protein
VARKFSFGGILHSVSKLIAEEPAPDKKLSPQEKSHRQEIENSILVLAAAVIRCDRNLSEETELLLHNFFSKQFGASGRKHRLTTINTHIETGTEPYTKIACKQLKLLTTHDSRLNILGFLFGIAASDDFLNAKETRCIHRIAGYLGISDKDFKELKLHSLSENNPYFILGIEEGASLEEVKTAYRKMILKSHPDRRQEDISEEEAGRKFREIQKAFDTIRRERKTDR